MPLFRFKFVLDYKIKELKKQIEPREMDIQGMTQQIADMDGELQNYNKKTQDLDLNIVELKLKLKAAEKEVEKERKMVTSASLYVKRFKIDLSETMQALQEPKKLKVTITFQRLF